MWQWAHRLQSWSLTGTLLTVPVATRLGRKPTFFAYFALSAVAIFATLVLTMHLRGTGAGFCYNAGRVLTSIFPFAVGWVVRSGQNPLGVVSSVAVVPATGALLVLFGLVYETRDV